MEKTTTIYDVLIEDLHDRNNVYKYKVFTRLSHINLIRNGYEISILIFLSKAPSQKLVLAPGAMFRGNTVEINVAVFLFHKKTVIRCKI